jgi:uncharacterized YccA/Bax inhibitor family protein
MDRSNPALNNSALRSITAAWTGERMSIQGTVTKSIALILLATFSASWVWYAVPSKPEIIGPAIAVGVFGGLIAAVATMFRPQWSPMTAPLYAVLEGLALGAISAVYQARYQGLPAQAIGLTCAVALGMLLAFRLGWLRATDTFRRVVFAATAGIALFYLATWILSFFHVALPFLYDASPVGFVFSLIVTGIAALNLVLDFDLVERLAASGAPKFMEWYGGFALLVTLVWLYLEMLRLLARSRR